MLFPRLAKALSCVLLLTFSLSQISTADELSEEDIERIIYNYLLENPEVVGAAIERLQQQYAQEQASREQAAVQQLQAQLLSSDLDPVGGNPNGRITLVEFFDYNCGYCKRSNQVLQTLIANNPDLRVVYKEWPILSEGSAIAARTALAVNLAAPESYEALHRALLASRSLRTEDQVWQVIATAGVERSVVEAKLDAPQIREHLRQTAQLAEQLGITGTPAFLVGDQILKGAYPLEQMQAAIDRQRAGL